MNSFISADAFEAAVEASLAHKATLNHRRRKVAEHRLQQHYGVSWGTAETLSCVPDVAVPSMGWLIVFLFIQCLRLKWKKQKVFYPNASRYTARCSAVYWKVARRVHKVYRRRKCALDRKLFRLYLWYIILRYIIDGKVHRAKMRCKQKLKSIFDRCKLVYVNVTVSIYHHIPPMRVSAAVIFLGLLMSGNVELNPGPKQREVKAQKVVISSQIKDPDRLFKDLAADIYPKYTELGIELGLESRVLEDELETGRFASLQGSKKALKMLLLWQKYVTEDNFTYSKLAAALEKHGFRSCAHKYCYTSSVCTGQLTVDDIISEIRDAHCKWEDIGLQLNIGKPDLDAINEEFRGDPQKCLVEMLTLWLRQGKSPTTWCKLISVLKHPTVGFQQLAEEIESKGVHSAEQSMSAVGVQTECPKQEIENGKQLYKCGCKNCPNKVEVGCSNPIPINDTFPRISIYDGLSEDQREVLKARLRNDSRKIMVSFHELLSSFYDSLTTRKVLVKQLVTHLSMINAYDPVCINPHTPLVQEHSELLASVTDIEGVIEVIRLYSSFFNYGVLEHLIKHCGSPEDQTRMQKYKVEFVDYSRRMIYECPSYTGCEKKEGHMDMIMKLHSKYDSYPLSALQDMRIMLGEILHINPVTLHLCKIEEGCIKLVFQIPNFVYKATFPLSAEQEKALLELGVLQLTLGDYYFPRKDSQGKREHEIQHQKKGEVKNKEIVEKKREHYEMLEERRHIVAIEEAIERKGKLDHTAMQGVFLGPARSGKSTLIKRLLKEKIYPTSPSTGAADKVIQVSVNKSSSIAMSVFESKWIRLTYSSEAIRLMMLTAKTHKKQQSSSSGQTTQGDSYTHPSTSLEMPAGYANPKATFEEALRDGGILTLREHLDGFWTLYISDTGGQMEFQEILPLLVSGPSLFFIVFPLNRDLNELFMIEYQLPDGERSEPYQSSLTLKEAILQSFSTISAMGTFTYKGMGREHVELKPKVLVVGTHRDLLEQSTAEKKIKEIDSFLQSTIRSMSFYRDELVEFAAKDQLIFTVNNLADNDSDFDRIRSRVNQIADSGLYQMSIPTHWLIFSLVIRRSPDRVISYDECFQVAQQCGIDSEDELHNALWFLHTKMGVIRYFRYGDVSKIVIIDPQLLFDKITELIIKTFTFDKGTRLSEEFTKKGLFSFEDFLRINTTQDPHLTHLRFMELLKKLRIVVPFPDGKRFLIPCVWTHADKALCPPKQHSAVPTLAIVFDCGYCPKGVTGSVIKYLMTNEMRSAFTWELQTDQIFCDQATFFVGPSLITLCMYPTHFEVVYAPSTTTAEAVCSIQEICREVCLTIQKAIHVVSKDINLACRCEPSFYCTLCKSHIAKLIRFKGIPCQLWCDKTPQFCDLPSGFHYWLAVEAFTKKEPERNKPSIATSSSTLTLPSALRLVFSLGAEWKNLGLFLNVDEATLNNIEHDYKKANDCLREMLSAWLKKATPPPSWETLAEAVGCFDQTVAAKIREMYCTS